MTELGKPTIARVNGHALAGGFGLVAACDLAIASDGAQFGMPEVNVGVWPMMIMAIVFRNVQRKAGMELMLTGKRIDASEAVRIGLINRHVAPAQLDAEVDALAAELAENTADSGKGGPGGGPPRLRLSASGSDLDGAPQVGAAAGRCRGRAGGVAGP